VGGAVFTGTSGSLLLHPREFIESRNEVDAMVCGEAVLDRVAAKPRCGGPAWKEACFAVEHAEMVERAGGGGGTEAFRGAAAGDAG
jgi:hypothetical protein